MAAEAGDVVWIRGPGLNSTTLPDCARNILGRGWETKKVDARVLAVRRGGVLQVRLTRGEEVFVHPEFLCEELSDSEGEEEEGEGGPLQDVDYGSDQDREDREKEDEGEAEGSEPLRIHLAGDEEWMRCSIQADQRSKEGNPGVRKGGMRQLDPVTRGRIFPYFWAFMPVEELDASLTLMQEKGRRWPGFELDRNIFC